MIIPEIYDRYIVDFEMNKMLENVFCNITNESFSSYMYCNCVYL